MMRKVLSFLAIILFHTQSFCKVVEVTDTVYSTQNDRVIISYEVSTQNGIVTLRFLESRNILGNIHNIEYELNATKAMFFDRIGSNSDIRLTGKNPVAIMWPSEIEYKASKDGYFLLSDLPSLKFSLASTNPLSISIPIFLVHYEGKKRYKIFCRCDDLVVSLPGTSKSPSVPTPQNDSSEQITISPEVEIPLTDVEEASIQIRKVSDLLSEQDGTEFTDELKDAISKLRDLSYRISDQKVVSEINEVLTRCKDKEKEIKRRKEAEEAAALKETERKDSINQARQDSIRVAQTIQAEKKEKRNLWLLIGGVLLAIIAFVANQAFQHFRNVRNQKDLLKMQDSIAQRAQNEAKRRAQSAVRNKTAQMKKQAKEKVRQTTETGVPKKNPMGKGKKFSI